MHRERERERERERDGRLLFTVISSSTTVPHFKHIIGDIKLHLLFVKHV